MMSHIAGGHTPPLQFVLPSRLKWTIKDDYEIETCRARCVSRCAGGDPGSLRVTAEESSSSPITFNKDVLLDNSVVAASLTSFCTLNALAVTGTGGTLVSVLVNPRPGEIGTLGNRTL